ncbi:MlaD family protein [Novipirellula artificiosorum]|uniref:Mce related protein n=1 Tax=Novipirellula artificiosorum TaxID=2528016 RepID=A0A5C6E192_9BACT|nr:MlaD family protein [Novipirellula artificiosorum]TWU42678.1 mce related protein [Novipirellula artificiosorum]
MDDNKLRFGVGVLVISAIGIGIILTFLFGAFPDVLSKDYKLTVKFPSAEGVSENTPVLRDGVRIGRVDDISLLPEGGVLVGLSMDSGQEIAHRYVPTIGNSSLVTGDSTIEFVRADERKLAEIFPQDRSIVDAPYGDGDYLDYGQKTKNPYSVLFSMEEQMLQTLESIRIAGDSISTAGQSVNTLATQVQGTVGQADAKVNRVADEAVEALEEFQGAMRDVRSIVGNPELRQGLEDSISQLPRLLTEAQKTLDSTQRTFEGLQRVSDRFERVGVAAEETVASAKSTVDSVDRTVRNVEKFTEPLAERGDEIVSQVLTSLANVDRTLAQVETFGKAVNNSNGSFRRFLEDEDIYWEIRRTIGNIEQASARIRPILDDVRIFSDKIARDPRQLGVRGAISQRPTGAGLK